MEVKEGNKKTEVGLIPREWECVELGSVSRYEGGSQPPLFTFSNIKKKDYIRLIQIRDYKTDKYKTYIPISLARRFCVENDIMIGRYGPPIFQILRGIKGAYNVALMKAIPLQKITNDFLYYTLKRDDLFRYIDLLSQRSSGQTGVDLIGLKAFLIALPPLQEQQTIASALSDIDRLISSLVKVIDKKKNIRQGAMQKMLSGKKRLNGYSGKWVEKRIDDIAVIISGGTPSTSNPQFWNGHIKWCTPTDITSCKTKYINNTEKHITEDGLKNSSACILPKGALLFCSRATIGEVRIANSMITTNQGFKSLVVNIDISNEWLYYWILTHKSVFIEKAIGSTFLEISKKDIQAITILVPTREEQDAIAQILSDMDAEIEMLERKLNKYQDIKQGMIKELLTGRIRLVTTVEEKTAVEINMSEKLKKSKHTKEFDEAVVISAIVSRFTSEQFPMGAFKRQKLAYLLHRHHENKAEGYEKFAAGPYNYRTKYGGAEKIAQDNKYVKEHIRDKIKGFVAAEYSQQAMEYFDKWYGKEVLSWLEQFRYYKNEELELLTTVDMAMVELRQDKKAVSVSTVKSIIQSSDEWKPKLSRTVFLDINIKRAIESSNRLFGN